MKKTLYKSIMAGMIVSIGCFVGMSGLYATGISQAAEQTPALTREAEQTPVPTQGAEQTPVPTQGAEQTPVPTQEAEQTPVPTRGAEQTPVPTQEAEQTPVPTQGAEQPPVPTQGAEQTPVPTQGAEQPPVPTQGAEQPPVPTQGAKQTPAPTTAPANIRLNMRKMTIGKGEIIQLKLNNLSGKIKGIVWETSDKNVATVSKKGVVKGESKGRAVISATYNGTKYNCKVTVTNAGLDYISYTMELGDTLRLHCAVDDNIKWSSSNKKVAKVKRGKVTAVKKGVVTIKAVADDRKFICNIKIINKNKGIIYLTFDDGPSLTSTPKILDILEKNNVKATFFTIAFDSKGAKLIKREASQGHSVAIHGASHDYGKIYRTEKTYMNNIYTQQKMLEKILGYKVWITRFPGGSSNLVSRKYNRGIMTKLVKRVDAEGFSYFDWNVGSGDAGGPISSNQVYNNVVRGLKKNRDNVVLMHDFSGNTKTIGALDRIIKYGKQRGYEFRAISASTPEVHHGVQN